MSIKLTQGDTQQVERKSLLEIKHYLKEICEELKIQNIHMSEITKNEIDRDDL